jgi:hypothetical protein
MKWLVSIVGLYLLLDLVTPGLPGAFAFEPQQSVEIARAQRAPRAHLPSAADVTPPAVLPSIASARLDAPFLVIRPMLARPLLVTWSPPPRMAAEPAEVDPAPTA